MKNKIVNFEVAKALKSVGFVPEIHGESCYNENGEMVGDYNFFHTHSIKADTFVVAPDIYRARDFVLEKYGIYISAGLVTDQNKFYIKFDILDSFKQNYSNIEFPNYDIELFNSISDAIDFGLNWLVANDIIKNEYACDKCGLVGSKCINCYK